jgi:hypothetical protein
MKNTTRNDSKPLTFDQAEELGAYSLAALWADRMSWPMPGRSTATDELAELACMSALARWLHRWQAIPIHRAILAGAEPEAAATAFGGNVAQAFECWHDWAAEQQNSVICGRPGVTVEDYATVAAAFVAAGAMTPGEKPERD